MAQGVSSNTGALSPSVLGAAAQPRTVQGKVINALTGVGVSRALVTLNGRKVLTDFQGQFEFPGFADSQAFVSAMKPGYSQSAEAGEAYGRQSMQQNVPDTSSPVEIKLYPEGALTGTVAGADGLPLSQVPVRLVRAHYDGAGLRWLDTGFAVTNSRGEYRLVAPDGRYRLVVGYVPRNRDTQEAVLPLRFPGGTSTDSSTSWIALASGEEKQIDLRPRTAATHPVAIRVDQVGSRQSLRFSAAAANGESFNLNSMPGSTPGEFRTELPAGSYTIHAQSETREDSLYGIGRVTVTDGEIPVAVIHLAPAASLSIELSPDATSGPLVTASPGQLGLLLHQVAEGADNALPDVPVRQREDRSFEFRVPPGRYRLAGNSGGAWYVESATYGGVTNLLTSDLVIAAGSAGEPIRLVLGNVRGNVSGKVTLPEGVSSAWVYLFPRQPTLAGPSPQPAGNDGSFLVGVPVGTYAVAAFAHPVQEDLRDPETLARLAAGAPTVEVTSGTNSVINLTLTLSEAPR